MNALATLFGGGKDARDSCACDISRVFAGQRGLVAVPVSPRTSPSVPAVSSSAPAPAPHASAPAAAHAPPALHPATPPARTASPAAPAASAAAGHAPVTTGSSVKHDDKKGWADIIHSTSGAGPPEHTWSAEAKKVLSKMEMEMQGEPSEEQQMWDKLGAAHSFLGGAFGIPEPFKPKEVIVKSRQMCGAKSALNATSQGSQDPMLDYHYFVSKDHVCLGGVAYFSPFSEGPPGMAHGGMIAAMLDQAMGIYICTLMGPCVTLDMETKFKQFVAAGSEVSVRCWVEKDDGRKHWVKSEVRSLDTQTLHAEGKALWLELKKKT